MIEDDHGIVSAERKIPIIEEISVALNSVDKLLNGSFDSKKLQEEAKRLLSPLCVPSSEFSSSLHELVSMVSIICMGLELSEGDKLEEHIQDEIDVIVKIALRKTKKILKEIKTKLELDSSKKPQKDSVPSF